MTALRVILDDILTPFEPETAGYARALTRQLIATAPPGVQVEGLIASSPEADYERLTTQLPGLGRIHKSALERRELARAWQRGIAWPSSGMMHAPSLYAPIVRHDRLHHPDDQTVVTIHDAVAWSHPDALTGPTVAARRALGRRAEKFADAIVVPSHSVAAELADHLRLGDRVRVIPGAPRLWPSLREPMELDLPDRFIVTVVYPGVRADLDLLLDALDRSGLDALSVQVIASVDPGVGDPRVNVWLAPSAGEQRALLQQASAYVDPRRVGGDGALLDALGAGTPCVHAASASLTELSASSSIAIPTDGDDYRDRLGEAIRGVLDDEVLAERMGVAGLDRARAFSWRDSAESVWQLHADL